MEIKHKEIVRAKVHLQDENPFFSYLVMNLNVIDDSKITKSCAIDDKGNFYYNPKWIKNLSDEELKAVLSHEVLHLALEHLIRGKEKHQEIFNIATDLVINNILINNNFRLPKGLVPYNNKFEINDKFTIEDLDKKSAEEVYNELLKKSNIKKTITFSVNRFDKHIFGKGKGKGENNKEEKENKNKWRRIFTEASIYAKQKGNIPSGIERLIDIVLNDKINWKNILYKYITRELPYDYSYSYPSKKSRATGIYMPSILRESIEIVVSVDTSGSISQEELSEFLGEIVNIAKSFSNINMKLIVCDSKIHEVYDIANGNIDTIMNLKICGGGGTSFKPPLDYIKENLPNTKFNIFFTDGYGDKINYGDYPFKLIWVITKNGTDSYIEDSGEVINLE